MDLTPEEYSRQAKDLWKSIKPEPDAGFKNDADVDNAAKRVAETPPQSMRDVEASTDVRSSVMSVAKVTAGAQLAGGRYGEKTIMLERKADGTIVIASVQAVGPQGGHVTGVTKDTVAVAHVHGKGLEHAPGKGDHSSVVSASVPSFVIIADTGVVWGVGRRGGTYVQRQIKGSDVGPWQAFRPH
ncbi:hypothetical protein [Sphingomonas sp.]|uniref:hypothetical protein n=1 Tax=Sphingomonas sp. TaxID=28214 RepID=UPI0035BBE7F3